MKKLIYSMLTLCCVAFALTFTSCGDDELPEPAAGTKTNPYDVVQAINAVKGLTWTSNTVFEETDEVYVKGKISRILDYGTFHESGTYSNASFYISKDGGTSNEFFCYRIRYFNRAAYKSGQTDIKVGDRVVIYGRLMNYRGNTPETVSDQACLYSLNGATDGGSGSGGSVSFDTNSSAQSWAAATDGSYGSGFATTTQGMKIAYYKHTGTSNPNAPNANDVRIYKNSVLSIASTQGKKIKKVVIKCAPDVGATTYCLDMVGLEGGSNAVADKSALTVTWNGTANRVVLQANNGQVRMVGLTVEHE